MKFSIGEVVYEVGKEQYSRIVTDIKNNNYHFVWADKDPTYKMSYNIKHVDEYFTSERQIRKQQYEKELKEIIG